MIYNVIAGLLGVLFLTLTKMKSLQDDAGAANIDFDYKKYFKRDAVGIILSFLSVFIWQLLFKEVAAQYPKIETFVRCSFFIMGAAGAWVIQKFLGKTKGWINGIVDRKTDIADKKIKPE